MTKADEFRVGDIVWCLLHGKGEVTSILSGPTAYPIEVIFENGESDRYILDGRYSEEWNRTLFFSEPKIEASVKRPFVPTLVGKRVVVKSFSFFTEGVVHSEDGKSFMLESGTRFQKEDVAAIYEISQENLLKP